MKQTAFFKKYLPIIITAVVGAVGGYLYYRFVGCASGTCVIASNPIMSTVFGGILGGLLGSMFIPGACCACSRINETTENK